MRGPILGVLAAIAITTTMDATGLTNFSALPLCPLFFLFWRVERLPRVDIGFTWGSRRGYGLAVLYPVLVLGLAVAAAWLAGAIDVSATDWSTARKNLLAATIGTALVTVVTEEGFFRGWLWASLTRRGLGARQTLLWTSAAFALWHVSAIVLPTGFDVPRAQIPVFMINATLLGLIWGLLRHASGSVLVASVSHGLWNGGAYVFFGYGREVGALGIANTAVHGPEVGLVGVVLNGLFAAWLWRHCRP